MDFEQLKSVRDMGFIKDIGFKLTEIEEGYAKGKLEINEDHLNTKGEVHQGIIFTIADTISGAAATSRGRYVTTMNATINYFKVAKNCTEIIGESEEVSIEPEMCVYNSIMTDQNGDLIAKATLTYVYLSEVGF